mgnify:CR=1 FL=1
MSKEIKTQVVVLGSGPGGYSAAFRAADLGLEVTLIERYNALGGVCLNVGCIPSKALLHVTKHLVDAQNMAHEGVTFAKPEVDIDKMRAHKDKVIGQLSGGVAGMAKMRKVNVVNGYGKFTGPNSIAVEAEDGSVTTVNFDNAIIAAGSRPVKLPFIPHEDPRVWDSTDALAMPFIPGNMLILGGGIIGLEMGSVYSALGAQIDVVEFMDQLIPAADKDIIKTFTKSISKKFNNIMLETKVTAVEAKEDGIYVSFEGKAAPAEPVKYDAVLVAVGRAPNGLLIDADKAGVTVTDRGFIEVNNQLKTNVPHIYAIGDIVGQPMLAHKAVHEAHVAAEVIAGQKHVFDPKVIPSIAYTDPEVATVGKNEKTLKSEEVDYEVTKYGIDDLDRAIADSADYGFVKVLTEKGGDKILGATIVGVNASDLLLEFISAMKQGYGLNDILGTIHPYPTMGEANKFAAGNWKRAHKPEKVLELVKKYHSWERG